MTLYLTEDTEATDVAAAHAAGLVQAVKLYPAGATTTPLLAFRISEKCRACWRRWPRLA